MGTPLIDVTDEYPEVDPFYVGDKDPAYYYCWVNKKPDNVERRKLEGYEVVTSKDEDKRKEKTLVPPNAVGERIMQDVILMRMPQERHERIVRRRQETSARAVGVANENAAASIRESGLEVEDRTRTTVKTGVFE